MTIQPPSFPAPRALKAALLADIGRSERLRWLAHADERAVAVGEGGGVAAPDGVALSGCPGEGSGSAWAEAAHEYHVNVGSGVAAEQVLPIAASLHAQALERLKRRPRESSAVDEVLGAQELLVQALLIRDRVGSAADELERLAHLDVVSDLGVALAQSNCFEASRAMQERSLRMVQGQEATYRGFVTQVHARLTALQRRQERFEQQLQSAAWLMDGLV